MMLQRAGPIRAARPTQRSACRVVVCQAQKSEDVSPMKAVALPLASMVAAALIAGAAMPEEALAASQRSGGRVGGSSGFAARKAAPARSIQTQAAPTVVNNTTVVVAPAAPVFSPFGFSPFGGFGGFGFGFGVPIFMPGSIFSGLLGLMAITLLFSVVFNVIRGIASANKPAKKEEDSWGDL
ncbi:hypothetical protein PLESTB_000474500 [Pleodorina starrii]|uniref:Uncharacterized protein n=1 Tax=Pleodorina starrii TaxID=330485 RepID=A0A9W6F004_9CHLO|nr:hypothetical protein PLESTM_001592200 [Pleodorina starrii]GLC51179.1 hypothetical protein PLESTB_000474500 [Pleodorina starrii]GLC63537.1 hypothetical protein PLESTF_000047000 [Pleodorina starrii]